MRGLRTVMVSLLAVVSAALAQENQDHSTKNSDAVQKRRARADAKSKFEEDNGATFDAYGRTIRYGTDIDDVECKRDKPKKGESGKGEWRCKVTKSSRRKYLTKEEKVRWFFREKADAGAEPLSKAPCGLQSHVLGSS